MLNLDTRLYVFHDDNSVFIDHSNSAQDYSRDEFGVELNKDEDYLYIGFRKPINAVYIEIKTANTNTNSFTLEYYKNDGVTPAFTSITTFSDETKGFTRSGFLMWGRNLEDEESFTVNSQEAYWYRLRPSATHSVGTEIQGINVVFSDDNDLKNEVANITAKFLRSNQTSHILAHVSARNQIIQDLRNRGMLKQNLTTGRFQDLNVFDVLCIEQLRESSKWKALSVIFDDFSDVPDDRYDLRARKYNSRYKSTMSNLQFLAIDVDDDGKKDINEEQASATMLVNRR